MANFNMVNEKIHLLKDAENLLSVFRIMYGDAKVVQNLLAHYQSDPSFKAVVDYLYAADERLELAAMITQINTLLTDWESNHPDVLGFEPQSGTE